MERSQIIEQLNDLAERARDNYIHTNNETSKKDNDAIMGALDLIGAQVRAAEVSNEGEIKNITFSADVTLLADLKALVDRKQQSIKSAPVTTPLLSCMAPGLRGAIPAVMKAAEQEADLIQRTYSRMCELLGGVR